MAFNPHEYLNSLNNFESQLHKLTPEDFLLTRIEKILDLAGNPHRGSANFASRNNRSVFAAT